MWKSGLNWAGHHNSQKKKLHRQIQGKCLARKVQTLQMSLHVFHYALAMATKTLPGASGGFPNGQSDLGRNNRWSERFAESTKHVFSLPSIVHM